MANLQYVYETLKKKNPGAFITQGFLRSDVLLTAANSNINFSFLQTQSIPTVKCQTLQPADAFCVTAIAMKIYKDTVDTGAGVVTPAGIAPTVDYSYPNASVFSGSGEAANLESLYNGFLQVTIQKRVIFSQFPAYKFRRVNTSQKGTQSATTFATAPAEEQYGVNGSLVGLEPTINMNGGWTMNFQLIPPAALNLAGTSSNNFVSLILDGFLLQNAANYSFAD